MTIGKKVGSCLAAIMLLSVATGIVGWFYVNALGNQLDHAIHVNARQIELAGELRANVYTFRLQERGMLLFSHIKAASQVASCREAYGKAMNKAFGNLHEIRSLLLSESDRGTLDQAEAGVEEYKARQLDVWALLGEGKVIDATESDKMNLVTTGARIIAALDRFDASMHSINAFSAAEGVRVRHTATVMILIALVAFVPIGVTVGVVLVRTTRQLRRNAAELAANAAHAEAAAYKISVSSQSLAQAAAEQAASLEETSASTEEINVMARRNTESSLSAAETVAASQRNVDVASQSLGDMIVAMSEIESSGSKISKIIKVIDEIAFQTNILALNAAVEAARAGESGLGFAVVADEVRSLAHRCADAARETATLIEDSIAKSKAGKQKVDLVAKAIQLTTAHEETLKNLMDQVCAGSREQSQGIGQIAKTIAQMEKVTSATAAGAGESASASRQLRAQSEALHAVVRDLIQMVGGHPSSINPQPTQSDQGAIAVHREALSSEWSN